MVNKQQLVTILTIFIVSNCLLMLSCQDVNDVDKEKIMFDHYQKFVKAYNRTYNSYGEMMVRIDVFRDNYKRLEKDLKSKKHSHTQGISQFFDLTPQEYTRTYLNLDLSIEDLIDAQKLEGSLLEDMTKGFVMNNSTSESKNSTEKKDKPTGRHLQSLPASYDWRPQGNINFIKNQGSCGSCWAFSATANIESRYFMKYGIMENLSEQQLINCDTISNGCNGGNALNAFRHLRYYSHGQIRETDLPYANVQQTCNIAKFTPVPQVTGWAQAGTQDETYIAQMLVAYGPLSVAINAKYLSYYRSGIIDETDYNCNPYTLNHAVNIVGYGTENGKPYWIVQNSWGRYWGESGYFRIARGKGTCGINRFVITSFVQ